MFYRRGLVNRLNESADEDERADILEQIRDETGLSEDQVLNAAENISFQMISLDKTVGWDDGRSKTIYNFVHPTTEETVEDEYIRKDSQAKLRELIDQFAKKLNEHERYILEKRYLDENPLTLDAIGTHFGITREAVRQTETKVLNRLRRRLINVVGDFLPGAEVFAENLF